MTQNGENQAMKPNPILPDDPRLTAYALNEMEAGERAQFEPLGLDLMGTTPAEFAAVVRSDHETWGRIIKQTGVKLD